MLCWALTFLLIALVGSGGIAVAAAGAAKFLFFLFMVISLVSFVLCRWQGEASHNLGWRQGNQAKRSLRSVSLIAR